MPRDVMRTAALGAALVALVGAPLVGLQGRVQAAGVVSPPVTLPVNDFGDMVLDTANQHVFVSSPSSNEVVVLDYDGNVVKIIGGLSGPDAMVVSGSTVYVTLSTSGSIDRIDTTTLAETGMLTQGTLVSPTQLVLANGALWTGTETGGPSSICLARVDLGTVAVTTFGRSYCYYGLAIRANPADTSMLITWDLGNEPATVVTLDVSSGAPVQLQSRFEQQLQNLQDIAGGPTGNAFVTASGYPYEFDEWRYSDLQQNGIVYPANSYPTAVATTGAQGGLMAGGLDSAYGNAVWVYRYDNPGAQLFVGDYGASIAPRGLVFTPDGQSLFAISLSWVGPGYTVTFTRIDLQLTPPPSVTTEPIRSTEGGTFHGDLGSVTGGTAPYAATIDWGDGSHPSAGAVAANHQGSFTVRGDHQYREEGSYRYVVTIKDATGSVVSAQGTATVGDAPVSVAVDGTAQPILPAAYLAATLTDADVAGAAGDYSGTVSLSLGGVGLFTFNCPSSTCTITADSSGGFSVTLRPSVPLLPGRYTATVVLADIGGASATATGTVTIAA